MTDDLATAIARLRRDATNLVAVVSCRDDLILVCDTCEQRGARLWTYGCKDHVGGPAVYCPTCGIPRAHVSGTVPLTYAEQAQEIARLRAKDELCGTWPKGSRRAFVKGAAWWAWHHGGATMFSSERDEAEAEAEKRFTETDSDGLLDRATHAEARAATRQAALEKIVRQADKTTDWESAYLISAMRATAAAALAEEP